MLVIFNVAHVDNALCSLDAVLWSLQCVSSADCCSVRVCAVAPKSTSSLGSADGLALHTPVLARHSGCFACVRALGVCFFS
eukprot:EC796812.1.p4 GENE.EC796812.1~~EC796812.1.p4  ORF type:complete len:81 (-),score=7.05 EC796812.1:296-538(-)